MAKPRFRQTTDPARASTGRSGSTRKSGPGRSVDELSRSVLAGNTRSAARVLSWIENGEPLAKEVLKRLYSRTGRAHVIGITGSAGSGKSTLVGRMIAEFRRRKKQLGILAVDPSSPFSGGALLGDRVRMRSHFLDDGVFIRSLATRNSQGGLSSGVYEATQLLDAMGKDCILIETIGIGQNQVDIARIASTVLVIITPESGDEIQALKAGVLEIADLLVVNKSDLPGAGEMVLRLADLLGATRLPIFKTSALNNDGIEMLIDGIEKHRAEFVARSNHKQRTLDASRAQVLALIRDQLMIELEAKLSEPEIARRIQQIADRSSDPYTAAETILENLDLRNLGLRPGAKGRQENGAIQLRR
jgi:LAO/AO transport system kinase